ncbi:MAG: tRNA pseudouridine(38-40) synthase TruA [Clostridiaceae bacterium]
MKILLYLEYDGTDFHGFQRQSDQRTVQEELEKALYKLFKEETKISGSSRTDAGVHARSYPVSFKTSTTIPPHKIAVALNQYLPDDLKAQESMLMPDDFDARFSSQGKTYSYHFLRRQNPSALYRNQAYLIRYKLDVELMKEASAAFLGLKDFTGFKTIGSTDPNPLKDMRNITIVENGDFLIIYITASGFLYNMARIIAGTLLDAGLGKVTSADILEIFKTGIRGRSMVLPARGLYLEKVYYENSAENEDDINVNYRRSMP